MPLELKNKKLNPIWDSLLSLEQKELVVKPGFGLTQLFPYMNEEDVKRYMDRLQGLIKEIKIEIREKY